AFAKASRRRRIMACTTSIGPGATNMVTAAAVAHANRLPVLLLPGDVFAGRRPDPVSGRVIRSHQRETGRKQSLTEMVGSPNASICCKTGSGRRPAKTSPGNNNTGRRLAWATAAAVTMLVAPGPIEVVQAITRRRRLAL